MIRPHRPTVAIVQRRLTDYRVPLFEAMRTRLEDRGIALRVLYGSGTANEALKSDRGHLSWGQHLPTRYFADGRICWQPFGALTQDCDLVVVTQENKLIYNVLALSTRRPRRIAFWGHGRNFQSMSPNGLRERFKRFTTRRVDWWFAYTEAGRQLIGRSGFPAERITTLDNTTDTQTLRRNLQEVSTEEIQTTRASLGLADGKTAIFVGSLYAEKRLDLLIDSGREIARRIAGFTLLVIGDGPDRAQIERAAHQAPWLKFMGPRKGEQLAVLLGCADVCLNPGVLGLGIVDMFVAGIPTVTVESAIRSPETDYLVSAENGLIVPDRFDAYVDAVCGLFDQPERLAGLSRGAESAGQRYTIENMASNFCDGIDSCLGLPTSPGYR